MKHLILTCALLVVALPLSACNSSTETARAHEQPMQQGVSDHRGQQADHGHAAAKSKNGQTGSIASSGVLSITVGDQGFVPSRVTLKKGQKSTLRFKRTSDRTCAKDVVFPELGVNKPLPLNQPVDVEIPTDKARTVTFQCGMGMYRSSVIIS